MQFDGNSSKTGFLTIKHKCLETIYFFEGILNAIFAFLYNANVPFLLCYSLDGEVSDFLHYLKAYDSDYIVLLVSWNDTGQHVWPNLAYYYIICNTICT